MFLSSVSPCLHFDSVSAVFSEESCWFTENYILPTELRREALQLQKLVEYDDEGAEGLCLCLFVAFVMTSELEPLISQRVCEYCAQA